MNREELPGELSTFRAVGATGFGLGAIGGLTLWLAQPGAIHSGPVAVATTVLCVVLSLTMALAPWERLAQRWQLAPRHGDDGPGGCARRASRCATTRRRSGSSRWSTSSPAR